MDPQALRAVCARLAHHRQMRACTVVLVSLLSCACGGAAASANAPTSTVRATIERSPDSGKVDRVGAADGALAPDGNSDLAFRCVVDGPVTALFLATVDETGNPTGAFQADTLVGAAESPRELGARSGGGTLGLGVTENDQLLNAPDGSLAPLGAGPHQLVLYVAASDDTVPIGTRLRLFVMRPNTTVLAGGMVTN